MKSSTLMGGGVVFTLVAATAVARAETIAFYDFADGTEGSAVTTLSNVANPGVYTAAASKFGPSGVDAYWTNSVPGNAVFSDEACTNMIAAKPMAIALKATEAKASSGAYLDMDGLGAALAGKQKFTVEWFWRADESYQNWSSIMHLFSGGLCVRAGIGYEGQAVFVTGNNNDDSGAIRRPIDECGPDARAWGWNLYPNTMGWRHWAVVYDGTGTDKIAKLYYDHDLYRTVTNRFASTALEYAALRFGAEITKTDGTAGNGRHGDITCIRVSDEALQPAQMMRLGINVFCPFKDGAAGDLATTVANTAVPGTFTGEVNWKNHQPKLSADRPGKYIFASSARDELLATDPMSLDNDNADDYWQNDQGYVTFSGLAGRLMAVACQRKTSVTFECFVRREVSHFAWGNCALWNFLAGSSTYKTFVYDNCTSVSCRQPTWNVNDYFCDPEGENRHCDGKWHHVAFVLTPRKEDLYEYNHKLMEVYLDYAQVAGATPTDFNMDPSVFRNKLADMDLTFGGGLEGEGNSIVGRVTAMRIRTGKFGPADFMVASDTMEKPGETKLRWRFEEGESGKTLTGAANGSGDEKWQQGAVTRFGDAAVQPVGSDDKPGTWVCDSAGELRNRLSAAFSASSSTNRMVLQSKDWSGLPDLHPDNWTMEFFFKADAAIRTADELLAGKGRINMKTGVEWYDWVLALQPNGKLALKGYRVDAEAENGKTAYSFADIGEGLGTGWHHVALTSERTANRLAVWIDGRKAAEEILASEQFDSLMGRYQFGHGCGQAGFDGKIDEVRLTARVLAQDEILTAYSKGLALIFR